MYAYDVQIPLPVSQPNAISDDVLFHLHFHITIKNTISENIFSKLHFEITNQTIEHLRRTHLQLQKSFTLTTYDLQATKRRSIALTTLRR